eukprot:TRINITY_DN534_c0_g1_i3.p1 TRINITY_DN534_c0_g1~~TRINITY_DN534_c0_g1_i3.p1  ORF type:complete len:294 (+),score=43.39 TRINITY_DN534_c0_g1_i3:248-1129(+)
MASSAATSGAAATFTPVMFPEHRCKFLSLVRHGEGYHNVAQAADVAAFTSYDYYDASLTPKGWEQALALRCHLAGLPNGGLGIELIVTSPLLRTMQTAAGVFGSTVDDASPSSAPLFMQAGEEANGGPVAISAAGCPPIVAVEMCREHLGRYPCDARSSVTLYRPKFPVVDFSQVETDEDTWWQPDERESSADLITRGRKFVQWLMARPERRIAIVSHSSFLAHMLGEFGAECGPEVQREVRTRFDNCEMRSLVLVDRGGVTMPTAPLAQIVNYPGGSKGTCSDDVDKALLGK